MNLQISIDSNAAAVLARLRALTPAMQQGIAGAIDLENQLTISHAQVNYLRGPRPAKLGVRTARLSRSLRASEAVVSGDRISSTIGTNVRYAGVHEHGFAGQVSVAAFTRRRREGDLFADVRTLAEFDPETGRITRRARKSTKRTASGIQFVRAHTRRMKFPARPFIAPSVQDRTAAYSAAVSAAILAAFEEGKA